MSDITSIQWADSTMNPIMGCGGCELFPSPGEVLRAIDQAVQATGSRIDSRKIYKELINEAYAKISDRKPGHKNAVSTTNIWHLREGFLKRVKRDHGEESKKAAKKAIWQSITCYAATLHLKRGQKLLKPEQEGNIGHAPIFEALSRFEGRAREAARYPDLLGRANPATPWKHRLPRLIFVSDMGDALSSKADFSFLKSDLMPAITSDAGRRHLWLWLTKRPERMAEFAEEIGGFPPNVCAMTTLTGPGEENLKRLSDLKKVKAHMRGLSIEPLWERIPPSKLKLKGIDWVIVGGESGSGLEFTRPFALEWAEELRDHCRNSGVAFFLKQLGRNPSRGGEVFSLKNQHGGDWGEWPDEALKVREFPQAFHNYRKDEMKPSEVERPISKPKKKKKKAA
jgi:protein gp37